MKLVKVSILTAAVGALAVTAACSAPAPRDAAPRDAASFKAAEKPAAGAVVMGEGSDRTASLTANDWVTYADHVMVVTVVDEVRQAPVKRDVERGEGLVARTVKLRVDKVLWSAPDAPQPAPADLKLPVVGWVFNNNAGAGERKMALHDASRLEKGHTYVKALEWIDDPCFTDPQRGSWQGLGSGDTIPFDKGVLGSGEFEGQARTVDQLGPKWRADAADARTLRGQSAGEPVAALVADLKAASPNPEGFQSQECDLTDR